MLRDVLGSHPQAAMLLEDSLTAVLQSVQMLASVRTIPEDGERASIFGVGKSFISGPFENVSSELEQLAVIDSYQARFDALFQHFMKICCDRPAASTFGSKSTIAEHWEDLSYLQSVLSDLRLLLIMRNPLNVVASSLRRRDNAALGRDVWHIESVAEAVDEWRASMRTMARIRREREGSTYLVKYEEFCADPSTVQDVFKFSGLPPSDEYPRLWRRELGDTRTTLSTSELDYLWAALPDVDGMWMRASPSELLTHYGA